MNKSQPPRPLWDTRGEELRFFCLGCERWFPMDVLSREKTGDTPRCEECAGEDGSDINHIQLGKDRGEEFVVMSREVEGSGGEDSDDEGSDSESDSESTEPHSNP